MGHVLAFLVALSISLIAVDARAEVKPLKEEEITQEALLRALGDETPADSETKSRGFRPGILPKQDRRQAPLLITFVSDSAELQATAKKALDVVARALQSERLSTSSFQIEGHADPRGSEQHNIDLSKRRAEAVVAYLVLAHGIAKDRLIPVGKGASELLNTIDKSAPENRRVTLVTW